MLSDADGARMQSAILAAREQQDSVGGAIECAILGLEPGVGAPDLGCNVEGILAKHMFAVPAVKGIAFGAGFDCTSMRGSQYNDRPYMDGDQVKTRTNFNGGVNGGITNGMPVVFEVAMRPTPSIARPQDTVNMAEGRMRSSRSRAATIPVSSTGRYRSLRLPRHWPYVSFWKGGSACE